MLKNCRTRPAEVGHLDLGEGLDDRQGGHEHHIVNV
jgi:hypothetical protein